MSARDKNKISYEAEEPSFLRRLRAQQAGLDPDRHERPIARARRSKIANADDDEDAPAYVDEESNRTLSKEEYEALLNGKSSEANATSVDTGTSEATVTSTEQAPAPTEKDAAIARQGLTEVGVFQKKRKAVKVVARDEGEVDGTSEGKEPIRKRPKKKMKAVALSFGDYET